jgi:hypothetical protein
VISFKAFFEFDYEFADLVQYEGDSALWPTAREFFFFKGLLTPDFLQVTVQ